MKIVSGKPYVSPLFMIWVKFSPSLLHWHSIVSRSLFPWHRLSHFYIGHMEFCHQWSCGDNSQLHTHFNSQNIAWRRRKMGSTYKLDSPLYSLASGDSKSHKSMLQLHVVYWVESRLRLWVQFPFVLSSGWTSSLWSMVVTVKRWQSSFLHLKCTGFLK